MAPPFLSRPALSAVLRSLMLGELRATRLRSGMAAAPSVPSATRWPDDLPLGEGGLGCDSLERLSLAAAVNEMFHLHAVGTEVDLLSASRFGAWIDAVEAAWRAGVACVTVTTSGSTGRPKRCTHAAAHLAVEVDALADRWADRRRIVALAPAHHIYGLLFTALLPDRLGVPVLDAEGVGAGRLAAALRSGDLVVSFPDRWAYLARSLPIWPAEVEGVVSTAPCPPELLADLAAAGLGRMTEVYGSSETAGIAMRDAPDAPYTLMPQWRFDEPFDGDAPVVVHAAGDRFPLMDAVARSGAAAFRLTGRRDGAVQVGGINVSPSAVADRLRTRPGVRDAAVRLMRPGEGNRLKAFLVPEDGVDAEALRGAVAAWAAANLSTAERPTAFTLGPALPLTPLGKGADW